MNPKLRLLTSTILAMSAVAIIAGLFLSNASGRQQQSALVTGGGQRTAIYAVTGFTFSTPQALTHPPIPQPSPSVLIIFDQDVEPEIKVDISGNIYATAIHGTPGGVDLWKSTDKGATFVYMGEPDGAQDKCGVVGTPTCFGAAGGGDDSIDVSSGGYLYVSSLFGNGVAGPTTSITMSTSMDGGTGGTNPGQAWQVNPQANGNPPLPINDRQWIAAYGPQTLYMTFDQAGSPVNTGVWFTKSTDAGKTFSVPAMIGASGTLSRENNLAVDQYNGNIYTTFTAGGSPNQLKLLKSTDGGTTWTTTTAYTGPAGTCLENAFPIIAVDRGGNIHVVFTQSTGCTGRTNAHVFLISSPDAGGTWTAPVQIDAGPGNNSTVMPWIVAGSPGVVDVTWYGSTMSSPDSVPNADVTKGEWWNVFFAQVTNALSATPSIAQTIVTGNVHNDAICSRGGGCGGTTRTLAEYYAMTIGPDGNASIVYPDEVDYCAAHPASNCRAHTYYTKQTAGPSAYAPPTGPAPVTFAPNIVVGTPGPEPGIKVDSHNCMFVTAPGHPWVWKSENDGLSFLAPVNPVAGRARTAGDEDILPIPQISGARPDLLYFADLGGLVLINIAESTDGGGNWVAPGPGGVAGQMDFSTDRQWISFDRGVPAAGNLTVYEMDHELATEDIRFSALTNDTAWSPPTSGVTAPEMILPPDSTIVNTNVGPVFVDPATHKVYGVFNASTIRTNEANPPFGKFPNVWEAVGAAPAAAGAAPGPFSDVPVFKGVQDSPTALPSPAPTPNPAAQTFGNNTGNDFPSAAIDAAGNIYVTWSMNNSRTNEYMVWMATSHDHGQNFYGPFQVSQGPGTAVMPWIAAGDAGRIEIVYYASTTPVDPNIADNSVEWNTIFAQSFNGDAREPAFTISSVGHHVMHTGPICNQGILCGTGTRTLADFFQVSIGPDGLANVAYADNGPFPLPPGNPDSSQAGTHAEFARQASGPLALTNPSYPTCLGNVVPLASVVSRMTHGSITPPFDIDLPLPAGTHPRGVECRRSTSLGTGNYTLVFTFLNNLVSVANAQVTGHDPVSGNGTVSQTFLGPNASRNLAANQYEVDLSGVSTGQYITVTLNSVLDVTGNFANVVGPQMGVLVGDVNADGGASNLDVSLVKAKVAAGATVDSSNFRDDVNADGGFSNLDVSITKAQVAAGQTLPSTP